jgi:hypothetical protein
MSKYKINIFYGNEDLDKIIIRTLINEINMM